MYSMNVPRLATGQVDVQYLRAQPIHNVEFTGQKENLLGEIWFSLNSNTNTMANQVKTQTDLARIFMNFLQRELLPIVHNLDEPDDPFARTLTGVLEYLWRQMHESSNGNYDLFSVRVIDYNVYNNRE